MFWVKHYDTGNEYRVYAVRSHPVTGLTMFLFYAEDSSWIWVGCGDYVPADRS